MDTFFSVSVKIILLLIAIGGVIVGAAALKTIIPKDHSLHRKIAQWTTPHRLVETARFVLLIVFFVVGAILTITYS